MSKVLKITITDREGPIGEKFPLEFSSFANVNSRLADWARQMDPNMPGYMKIGFYVLWEDGHEYKGRYDLSADPTDQDTSHGMIDLACHILDALKFGSGDHCPSHMTQRNYETFFRPGRMMSKAIMANQPEAKKMLAECSFA